MHVTACSQTGWVQPARHSHRHSCNTVAASKPLTTPLLSHANRQARRWLCAKASLPSRERQLRPGSRAPWCSPVQCAAAAGTALNGHHLNSSNPDAQRRQAGLAGIINGWRTDNLRGDIYGGLTAAVVALPLALAFGVASGAGPLAGLYSSVFVGFFAALFGGTPSQVSGPTGPMTVVFASVFAKYQGTPGVAFACVIAAGLLQMLMGLCDIGQFVRLVPLPVTSGFMSGIGCIILTTQSLPLLGHAPVGDALQAFMVLPAAVTAPNVQALLLGGWALACCALTPRRLSRLVPGSLLALLSGTALSVALRCDVPVLGVIPASIPRPVLPHLTPALLPSVLHSALILAILGAIDSLLTSLAADSMTGTYHKSDRELIGQGIGNALSGLFGGMPGAGATMRTVVNVRAGGRTPLSGAVHALAVLACLLGVGRYAGRVPLAVLAGILVKSGADILDLAYLRRLPALPRTSALVMATVLALTVLVDLIAAVAAGCILSSLLYMKSMADYQLENCLVVDAQNVGNGAARAARLAAPEVAALAAGGGALGLAQLRGTFTFNAANGMCRLLMPQLDRYDALILDLTRVDIVDDTAALAIEEMLDKAADLCRKLYICGADEDVTPVFDQLDIARKMPLPPSTPRLECLQVALKELTTLSGQRCSIIEGSMSDVVLSSISGEP